MPPKLILTDGIPGAGKSVAAQMIARRMNGGGRPVRWWYEEEVRHPIFLFQDLASLSSVSRDLFTGAHERVLAAAVAKWAQFAEEWRRADVTLVVDGTFFGYMTWSLHFLDRPEAEVRRYLRDVETALAPLEPRLIYLRHTDVAGSWRNVMAVRGRTWSERAVHKASDNAYARGRGLAGFDGLVRLWSDYQALEDRLFADVPFPKLPVDVTVGKWSGVEDAVASFLDLPPARQVDTGDVARFTGEYREPGGVVARIGLAEGHLTVHGLDQTWPGQRLVPSGDDTFEVLSLPFTIRFQGDTMRVDGPELLGGRPPTILTRNAEAS